MTNDLPGMTKMWTWIVRVQLTVVLAALIVYVLLRPFTSVWVDVAFFVLRLGFVGIWLAISGKARPMR